MLFRSIKEETDLTVEESRRLPYLRTGDVFISSASMGRTIYARIRAAYSTSPHTENPFDELKSRTKEEDDKFFNVINSKLPINNHELIHIITDLEKEYKLSFTVDSLEEKLIQMVEKGYLRIEETIFGYRYRR